MFAMMNAFQGWSRNRAHLFLFDICFSSSARETRSKRTSVAVVFQSMLPTSNMKTTSVLDRVLSRVMAPADFV